MRSKKFSHSAGGIVLNSNEEVLVVRQRDESWSLPKGTVGPDEDLYEAAVREIAEETGIVDLSFVKILGSYSRYRFSNTGRENTNGLKRITMYLFTTPDTDRELHPMDPRIVEAQWVPKDKVSYLLTHPRDKEFFESVIKELNLLLVA